MNPTELYTQNSSISKLCVHVHDHVCVHSQRKHKSLGSNIQETLVCAYSVGLGVRLTLRAAGSSSGAVSYDGLCGVEYCRFQRTPTSAFNRMSQITRAEDLPLSEIGYRKIDKLWLGSAASQPSRIDPHVQLQIRLGSLRSSQTWEGTQALPFWVLQDLPVIAYRQNVPPSATPVSFGICDQVSSNFLANSTSLEQNGAELWAKK